MILHKSSKTFVKAECTIDLDSIPEVNELLKTVKRAYEMRQ